MYKDISPEQFKQKYLQDKDKLEIIDVRTPWEFNDIRIAGSKLISMDNLWASLDKIDWSKEVIFVCRTWNRSWYVANVLSQNWYNLENLAWWISILSINCQECMEKGQLDSNFFEY